MFEIYFQLRETFDSWYSNENHIRNDDSLTLQNTHIHEFQFNSDFSHIYPDSAIFYVISIDDDVWIEQCRFCFL